MRNIFFLLCLFSSSVAFLSCGDARRTEKIDPLYSAENLEFGDIKLQYWSSIKPTTVEPSKVHKFVRSVFGWIPIVGDLLELPVDLTRVILPKGTDVSHPDFPVDGEWNDPKILRVLRRITISHGYLRVTPPKERRNFKPERCWVIFKCPDAEFDDFLTELRVYLVFKEQKRKKGAEPTELDANQDREVLLAAAKVDEDYNKTNQRLTFHMSKKNLRPYLDRYGKFEIKLVATGTLPKRRLYLDGRFRIDLELVKPEMPDRLAGLK